MFSLLLLALAPAQGASVSLRVANPVAVPLPNAVHFLGIGHRNLPADSDLHPGIAAEAEHTHEVPGGDLEAAGEAVHAAFGLLIESGRFDVVEMGGIETADRRGRFADLLLPAEVQALCTSNEVEALLILEGLDTDIEEEGKEVIREGVTVFEARQLIEGRTLWRTYLCETGSLMDEDLIDVGQLRFEDRSSSDDPEAAWANLPEASTKMVELGQMAGQLEARRLAPSWVEVSRKWIPGGSPALKAAAASVRASDWSGAIEQWGAVFDSAEGKVRGKAAFNLALAAERSGDMTLAREWLALAEAEWPSGAVETYVLQLERRLTANQMATRLESKSADASRPDTPESDLPLAIPAEKKTDTPP